MCVDVADKKIVRDVSGYASPGRILAILGPSGNAAINYVPHYPHDGLGRGNWWGNVTLLLEVCALL